MTPAPPSASYAPSPSEIWSDPTHIWNSNWGYKLLPVLRRRASQKAKRASETPPPSNPAFEDSEAREMFRQEAKKRVCRECVLASRVEDGSGRRDMEDRTFRSISRVGTFQDARELRRSREASKSSERVAHPARIETAILSTDVPPAEDSPADRLRSEVSNAEEIAGRSSRENRDRRRGGIRPEHDAGGYPLASQVFI